MSGAARRSSDTAAGEQIGLGQNFVTVEGMHWMVLGDVNAVHGIIPHVPGPDAMAEGSSILTINGIPACREGHSAGCGHATSGSSTVFLAT